MSRFFGKIGFAVTEETQPGVWEEILNEREYYGDLTKCSSRWENSGNLNDNINLHNEISIMADPYAYQHFSEMKYVELMGVKWKINSVSVERPRLSLSIGGLYNGQ